MSQVVYVLILGALLLVARCIINVIRFRHLPGPPLAKFTDLWSAYAHNQPSFPARLSNLHQKYGKLVRIAPNHISVSDPAAIPIIYGTNPVWEKAPTYGPAVSVTNGRLIPSIISMSEAQHTYTKRAIGRAFTTNSLLDYESSIDTSTHALLTAIQQRGTLDIGIWFQYFAMDVINRIAFTDSLGFLETGTDVDGILEAVTQRFDHWNTWSAVPKLEYWLTKVPYIIGLRTSGTSPLGRISLAKVTGRQAFLNQQAIANKAQETTKTQPQDLLDKFIDGQARYPDLIPKETILSMVLSTIAAGADTTATTLSITLYLLLAHPHILSTLISELSTTSNPLSNPPRHAETSHLPYLTAVLKESMRHSPVIGSGLDRIVPSSGATISGTFIPGGTVVAVHPDAVMRDRDVFGADADEFRPERWLEADEERKKGMERAFLAFGAGKRICIGLHIAWMEMRKILPVIVLRYEMELMDPKQDVLGNLRSSGVKYVPEIMVRFSPRDGTLNI